MIRILLGLVCLAIPLSAQEVLRGEVKIELEQVRGFSAESAPPLSPAEARKEAINEAARYFGAMIYGWSFHYEVVEKARGIEEKLELIPLGTISADDPRLEPTNVQFNGPNLYLWADYRPEDTQRFRLAKWKAGSVRSAQGYGESPLDNKYAALEDAARAAIRAMLRGGERNRPKEASGYISLADFPRYWLSKGQWAAAGRFRVEILAIESFAAY